MAVGLVLGASSLVVYARSGYGREMLTLWLAAVLTLGLAFANYSRSLPRVGRLDLALPAALALVFSPLYLLVLYRWPVQVNSDEMAIIGVSQHYAHLSGQDPFGLSYYLNRPTMLFLAWSRLGGWLGGIDLFHMRLLHGLVGLLVIAASYALFRQLFPRWWAVFATFVVAINHSLFMISRLAMRENTAVLVVVVGLALLLWGFRNDHAFASFLGGFVGGLGYYVYFPGRATFPLWALFLVAAGLLYRRTVAVKRVLLLGAIAAAGFVLMAGPVLIAETKIPVGTVNTQHETLFIYPEARKLEQRWVRAPTERAAYLKNAKYGLGAFNNTVVDNGFIYPNYGHGFVDPLTGVLLWVGVGVIGIGLVRRRREREGLLMLGGFVVLWLSFALLINKAPNYTRLLVVLPFVGYLVAEAVRWLASRWRSIAGAPALIVGSAILGLTIWNLAIAWDFVQVGRKNGQDIGNTGRYVAAHDDVAGQKFYIVRNYFDYEPGSPDDRLRPFADDPSQVPAAIDSAQLPEFAATPPFVIFMRRATWAATENSFAERYPNGRLRNVLPDGTRVVLEVPVS